LGHEQLQVNPSDVDVHLHMAECLAIRGDKVSALANVMNAGVTSSGDPHVVFFVAMIFNQIGETDQAIEWVKRAAARGLPRSELASWVDIDNLRQRTELRALFSGAP
jgi:hypothetical protein